MKTPVVLLVIALLSQIYPAAASTDLQQDTPARTVAVVLLENDEYGPDRRDSYHHQLVGSLQLAFKRAEKLYVLNALVPAEKQPEKLGKLADIKSMTEELKQERLDTLLVIDAITFPETHSLEQNLTLRIEWQLYDLHEEAIYGSRAVTTQIDLGADCVDRCFTRTLNRNFVKLAQSQVPQTIETIRAYYQKDTEKAQSLAISQRHLVDFPS